MSRSTLRVRLGPPVSDLDIVRARHRRLDTAGPDDTVTTTCTTCYIFDDGWPCAVARLVDTIDAHLEAERMAFA